MIKQFLCPGLIVVFVLLPVSVSMAEGISFDYAQADYISDTIDIASPFGDLEGNGIGFSLSLSFASAFAVKLAVASTTFDDFQGMSVDTSKITTLGVTAHTSVMSGTEVFTNVSAIKAEIAVKNGIDSSSASDYGALVDIGLRHRVIDVVELEVRFSHVHVLGYALDTTMVGGRFYFRKRLSAGVSYMSNNDLDTLAINVRMDI